MSKEIQLTQGKVAIVDDDEYPNLSRFKWYYERGYARRTIWVGGRSYKIQMHRVIMGAPTGTFVDHISGNGLDNQKVNLRICSHAENLRNRKVTANSTSGYKGVTWRKDRQRWLARIMVDGQIVGLGTFTSLDEAVLAYDNASVKLHGEFASPNRK